MKKRLIALLLALVMLTSSALAVTHKSAMIYERPNLVHLNNLMDQLEVTLTENGAINRIIYLYNEMQTEYEHLYTMHSLATLRRYQAVNNKQRADEVSECYKILVDAFEVMRSAMVAMCSSRYEDTFREAWGDEVVDAVLESDPMTDEERELEGKISEKLAEYSVLSADVSAEIDGVRISIDSTNNLNLRREIYSRWQREMGTIYLELVSLRKQLSKDENYLSEAYKGFYRDYSPQNARALEDMVAASLGKVYDKVGRVYDSTLANRVDLEMSMTEAVDLASPALSYVDRSLADSYSVMKKNELYDIEYSDRKASVGFTITFPSYETPFIFFQPNGHIDGLHTFFHEFGHFNQILNSDMHEYWPGSVLDLDASEVTSQALPLMVGGAMDTYFGEDVGELFRQYNVDSTMFALLTGCLVDEFEQYVYATENLTVDSLNEKFEELVAKYHIPWDGTVWTQITHIYETPGYYISYAVSAITAMEIWEKFETNPTEGKTSYLKAVDACENGYRTMLAQARLRNPFSAPELLEKIRTLIEDEFTLLVDTYGHWAEDEVDYLAGVGVISGYRGGDGKYYFRPNQNVTRAEFVKLLYSLTGGTDETYTEPFADVSDTDWFAPYVAWASENGLVNGVSETRFNPNGTITRQDMAVILERFLAFKNQRLPSGERVVFTDALQISEYARYAVDRLKGAGILNGLPDGSFNPRGSVTRAAAATALYTTLEVVSEAKNTVEAAQFAPITLPEIPMQAKLMSMMVH